jgi:hypothetical protein|tara:strand:+ start:42 stop:248 length:207 start_codon:yes stop_codon:yes gene_type:complete
MTEQDRDALRLTVPKQLALQCQNLLAQQGVPLNVTQAVKAMLTFAIQTKTEGAAQSAKGVADGFHSGT